ncbi:MAG: hypothetical protein QNJ69_04090 [Gammaproteobacteria bacterium]|nr:hypothetical protein [Gammaproteobacteria bacterium]
MRMSNSPLRLLVKSYADNMMERKHYLKIRKQLLNKLEFSGSISHEELLEMMEVHKTRKGERLSERYSKSDWLIIALGLTAAAGLGLILFG